MQSNLNLKRWDSYHELQILLLALDGFQMRNKWWGNELLAVLNFVILDEVKLNKRGQQYLLAQTTLNNIHFA